MVLPWLSIPLYITIQLGFAGALGTHIHHLRARINYHQVAALIALSILVMLSPLSMPTPFQWLGWITATLVIVLFTFQPAFLPSQFWTKQFALHYFAVSMLGIVIWGIFGDLSSPFGIIIPIASIAGFFAWLRGRNI